MDGHALPTARKQATRHAAFVTELLCSFNGRAVPEGGGQWEQGTEGCIFKRTGFPLPYPKAKEKMSRVFMCDSPVHGAEVMYNYY